MVAVIFRRRFLGNTGTQGVAAVSRTGIRIQTHNRIRRTARREGDWPADTSLVIRWGCTAQIPVDCNNVLNKVEAIHLVNDKPAFRQVLQDADGYNPGDLCPITYFTPDFAQDGDEVNVIVRPRNHAQGRRLVVTQNMDRVRDAFREYGQGAYASEIIDKVAEYRVFVLCGRAVWVARKTPGNPQDMAWNVANGGRFDNVPWGDWPLRAVKTAIQGFNLSGLDFGGVDVIVDAEGKPYIVEINSAPSQTSPYRQECTAKVFDYVVQHGKQHIGLIEQRGGWRKFIHPALHHEAYLLA